MIRPMGTEIERRFLVRVKRLPKLRTGSHYEQGYLSTKPVVRVRATPEGCWMTVKGPGKVSRGEWEYPIPARDADEMLELCKARLTKTRRKVRVGAHTWDLDEFLGRHEGLWIAEVELLSVEEGFELPEWVGREVTYDSRYSNASLARAARPPARKVRV